jgi:hypothetical protein
MATEYSNHVLRTISQFCIKYPAFTESGERWKIFNAESNGMSDLGVIVRIGRRVYYDENRYFLWIELQNTDELDAVVKLIRDAKSQGKYLSPEDAVAQRRQPRRAVA